jgi:hypothetical protein
MSLNKLHPPMGHLRIGFEKEPERDRMRIALVLTCIGLLLPALAAGQKLELKLDSLAAKASEKAVVDLDGSTLGLAKQKGQLGAHMPATLEEVHVRNYEFSKSGGYSDQDLEPLRRQLRAGSGWSRILNVKEKQESTEIYTHSRDDKFGGFLIVACEADEVSIVHLVGTLTPEQVKELVGSKGH